jgi:hypothetical protein
MRSFVTCVVHLSLLRQQTLEGYNGLYMLRYKKCRENFDRNSSSKREHERWDDKTKMDPREVVCGNEMKTDKQTDVRNYKVALYNMCKELGETHVEVAFINSGEN